jgi:chemotaxis protein CheD
MENSLTVGLGEIQISQNAMDVLVAFGLGSCVGVGLYDPVTHIAGMLHAVLPESNGTEEKSAKYVACGIPILLDQVIAAGGLRNRLIVRIAGGANMLTAPGFTNAFDIGTRNIAAARATLASMGLTLRAEEVGGNAGRTVRLFVADGRMTIRSMGNPEHPLG